jgi:acyl carrier protein
MEIEEKYSIGIPDDLLTDKNNKGGGISKDITIEKLVGIIQVLKEKKSMK